jgi:predicted nucleotidyltransferase
MVRCPISRIDCRVRVSHVSTGKLGDNAVKTKIEAPAKKKRGRPDPGILADTIKRVVQAAKPDKVVMFGSAARGTMGPDSDLDLLVIKGGKFDRHRITTAIYRNLSGAIAVDAVVVTPEEVERYRDTHCLVICPALREGKVVYGA